MNYVVEYDTVNIAANLARALTLPRTTNIAILYDVVLLSLVEVRSVGIRVDARANTNLDSGLAGGLEMRPTVDLGLPLPPKGGSVANLGAVAAHHPCINKRRLPNMWSRLLLAQAGSLRAIMTLPAG
jgi:hypothetical protein